MRSASKISRPINGAGQYLKFVLGLELVLVPSTAWNLAPDRKNDLTLTLKLLVEFASPCLKVLQLVPECPRVIR
jgi:hypothetical protein